MSVFDGEMKIRVSAASGTEAVLKRELIDLGYSPGGANLGRVDFNGDMRDVARANIFLRTAGRVRILLAEFPARTFDELYEGTRAFPWEELIPRDGAVAVSAKSAKSKLFSLRDIQKTVKKAVAERMASRFGNMSERGERYDVEASIVGDLCSLTLDTSGAGLHKRGYRVKLGEAPIRETLAAAMLLLSVWRGERPFLDPFCGTGTIAIEAALMATDTAPGLIRTRPYGFEKLPQFDAELWARIKEEAAEKRQKALDEKDIRIYAS